jgi:hypothetical protein
MDVISQVQPGMDLRSSEFMKWGEVTEVQPDAGQARYVIGTVDTSGHRVFIPESELLEIHGQCLRLARVHAELDHAGFETPPPTTE